MSPAGAVERILVRAPNPVGDCVMATASVGDIRRAYPGARLAVLARRGREAIFEGSPDLDEIVTDDSGSGLSRLWALARRVRRERYDLAILLTNSLRAALVARVAGVPMRVGYAKGGQGLLLTHRVRPELENGRWRPTPMPVLYARLCAAAGVPAGDGLPRLHVSPACEERAAVRRAELGIAAGECLIGLSPGASFGPSKVWPIERFAVLADRLSERYGQRTILFAGPGEEGIAAALQSRMTTRPISTATAPLGLDLLKPFLRDLLLLVTTDSGPRHYAVAFGTPTVVLMGPTDPRWSAVALERQDVVRHDVPCGPCHLKTCPLDHRCMTSITVDEVLARADVLLRRLGALDG